jgi:hypothetical protein
MGHSRRNTQNAKSFAKVREVVFDHSIPLNINLFG